MRGRRRLRVVAKRSSLGQEQRGDEHPMSYDGFQRCDRPFLGAALTSERGHRMRDVVVAGKEPDEGGK